MTANTEPLKVGECKATCTTPGTCERYGCATEPSPAEVGSEGLPEPMCVAKGDRFDTYAYTEEQMLELKAERDRWYGAAQERQIEINRLQSLSQQFPAMVEGELTFEAWWGQATGYSQMTKMELAEFAWKACASMRQPPAHADLLSVLQEAIDGMGGSYGVWAPKAKAVVAKYAGCALNQRLAVKEGEASGGTEVMRMREVADFLLKELQEIALWSKPTVNDVIRAQKALRHAKEMLSTHPVSDDQQAKDAARWNESVKGNALTVQCQNKNGKPVIVFIGDRSECANWREAYTAVIDAALSATKQEEV